MIAVQAVATSGTALRILLRGSLGIFWIQIATGQTWFLDPDKLADFLLQHERPNAIVV